MDSGREFKKVRSTTARFASACHVNNNITIFNIKDAAESVLAALYPDSMNNETPEYFNGMTRRWQVTNPLTVEQSQFPKTGQPKSIGLYLKSFSYDRQNFHMSFFGDINGNESPIDWGSVHMTTDGTKGRRLFYSVNWTEYGPKVTYKPSVTLSGDSNSGRGTSESDSDLAKDKTLVDDCAHLISGLLMFMMDKSGFDENYYLS